MSKEKQICRSPFSTVAIEVYLRHLFIVEKPCGIDGGLSWMDSKTQPQLIRSICTLLNNRVGSTKNFPCLARVGEHVEQLFVCWSTFSMDSRILSSDSRIDRSNSRRNVSLKTPNSSAVHAFILDWNKHSEY